MPPEGASPFASQQIKMAEAKGSTGGKSRLWQQDVSCAAKKPPLQAPSQKLPERGAGLGWRGPGQPVFLPGFQSEAVFPLFVLVSFKTSRCLESFFKGRPFWVVSEIRLDPFLDDSALNYILAGSALPSMHSASLSGAWGTVPGGEQRGALQPGDAPKQLEPTGRTLASPGFMSSFLRYFPSFRQEGLPWTPLPPKNPLLAVWRLSPLEADAWRNTEKFGNQIQHLP